MMSHVLDNPIYNALISGNNNFAKGVKNVKYYIENIAAFAGLKDNSIADFELLHQISNDKSVFVLFSIYLLEIPRQWELITNFDMYQMVFEESEMPISKKENWVDLKEENVQEMKDLVALTKPGPFLDRTIEFGNYIGIFNNGKLASMAGHRFNPTPYQEISAVCTDPDYLGNGYASFLLQEQIKRILERNEMPFLHVRKDNDGAVKLYEKLGFKIRVNMNGYVIKKV